MKEGVYTNLSNQEYHSHKESISRSALMDFDHSPYTYWAKHLNSDRPRREPTPQMELGSAFHALMLEPKIFDETYIMKPEPVFLKDVGRESYDKYKGICEFLETCGSTILTIDQWDTLMRMKNAVKHNEDAIKLIEGARIENSFFWRDQHSGLLLKSRPDILHENMYIDLKTTSDASPRAYQSEMVKYGYHIQGAMVKDSSWILEAKDIKKVINIVVETKYPFNIGIYIIDEFALEEGHMKYKQLLLDLKNALEKNEFKGYGIQKIGLPKWAL